MKTKILSFFKKYFLCFVLGLFPVLILEITASIDNDFVLWILFYGIPAYCLLYGCLFRIIKRNFWITQLIFFIVNFVLVWSFSLFKLGNLSFAIIASVYVTFFSAFGAFAGFVVNCIKEGMK